MKISVDIYANSGRLPWCCWVTAEVPRYEAADGIGRTVRMTCRTRLKREAVAAAKQLREPVAEAAAVLAKAEVKP